MAFDFAPCTGGVFVLAAKIPLHAFTAENFQKMIPPRLLSLIPPLQLEGIKPTPAAAALANIDHQAAHLRLGQFIETRWAFHISNLHRNSTPPQPRFLISCGPNLSRGHF